MPDIKKIEVEWKDPPGSSWRGRSMIDWEPVAEKLRRKKGKWAFVGRHSTGTASRIQRGHIDAFQPAFSFEATTRNSDLHSDEPGVGPDADIYARYIGDE